MYNEICPPNATQHVVTEGDTFWKLAQSYGIDVQKIIDANPGINANNLQIGSMLCIPANSISSTSRHTCPDRTSSYTVHSGDTLWKLSQANGVSVQDILDMNPGIDPQNLQIGSALCIPAAQAVPAPSVKTAPLTPESLVTCPKGALHYTIQSGDTLWKLSQVNSVSVQDILDVNPGIDPQNLQIGSTLCIPAAQAVPTPSVKAAPPAKTAPLIQAAPLAPKTMPVTCPKDALRYTIQSGDTLWKLSQANSVSVQDILDANPGIDPQNLQIGSVLCIPAAQAVPAPSMKTAPPTKTAPLAQTAPLISTVPLPPVTPPMPAVPTPKVPQPAAASSHHFAYCVKRCDTICGIARKFYVSPESILRENPGINLKCLQAGTYICVPLNCCGENTWRYTVMEDDTLNRIANKLNVCPSALTAANPNIDFQHLIHCQVICIPKE